MSAVEDLLDAGWATGDGLRVARLHEGYTVAVAGRTRGRLDRSDAAALLREHPAHVAEWNHWERTVGGHGTSRRAFLRWVEAADERPVPDRRGALREGVTETWGELRVTARLDGEDRRYALRHVADADRPAAELERHDDPRAARDVATHDERGRYRPLKTAPSLRTGWQFPDLSGAALVEAVDFFYPATVANWHREREGELDVTHYREAADRHTGIYRAISGLSDEQVGWLAEACCVDSQCLKRREWDLTGRDELDVPRGDGAFPCREPCSLVVAAAREFDRIDGEETRTYELELAPSEREALDDLVDAVADGRVDDVREADLDDGANRYRARYLRAKRDLGQDRASR